LNVEKIFFSSFIIGAQEMMYLVSFYMCFSSCLFYTSDKLLKQWFMKGFLSVMLLVWADCRRKGNEGEWQFWVVL